MPACSACRIELGPQCEQWPDGKGGVLCQNCHEEMAAREYWDALRRFEEWREEQ